jgi:hypothetical protein
MKEHQDPTERGHWIQTYTGRRFYLTDPRPEDLDIIDIAAALSKCCRFTGHGLVPLSVAEHSVLVKRDLYDGGVRDVRVLRRGLLHDAAEAYLGDMSRPLKSCLPEYRIIEDRVMRVVAQRFDFDWPGDLVLKEADDATAMREVLDNMSNGPLLEHWRAKRASHLFLLRWPPAQAMAEFLREARLCGVEF